MKKRMLLLSAIGIWILGNSLALAAENAVIADFNNGQPVDNLGQKFEVWLKDNGVDETQTCAIAFVDGDTEGGDSGKALEVNYDVESEGPAYNGMRFNLNGFDASGFSALSFYVKGDAEEGFSDKFKIEMIGASKRPSPTIVTGITDEWQKITIPFSEFFGVRDWTALHQLVIVFADILNDPKTGTYYFDNFSFE